MALTQAQIDALIESRMSQPNSVTTDNTTVSNISAADLLALERRLNERQITSGGVNPMNCLGFARSVVRND